MVDTNLSVKKFILIHIACQFILFESPAFIARERDLWSWLLCLWFDIFWVLQNIIVRSMLRRGCYLLANQFADFCFVRTTCRLIISHMQMASTGCCVKVSKSIQACSYHNSLIECLASRTLTSQMFVLRIKFNITYGCQDDAAQKPK